MKSPPIRAKETILIMRDLLGRTLGLLSCLYRRLPDNVKLLLKPGDLVMDISLGSKATVLQSQHDFLNKLITRNSTTHEIGSLAARITGLGSRSRRWEKKILRERITIKKRQLLIQRREWKTKAAQVESLLPPEEVPVYKRIKSNEITRVWEAEKQQKARKLRWLKEVRSHDIQGILNNDRDLIEKYGAPEEKGLVLGGIEATDNVKAFLSLDPKFKVYEKLDHIQFAVDLEVAAYKQRISRA